MRIFEVASEMPRENSQEFVLKRNLGDLSFSLSPIQVKTAKARPHVMEAFGKSLLTGVLLKLVF